MLLAELEAVVTLPLLSARIAADLDPEPPLGWDVRVRPRSRFCLLDKVSSSSVLSLAVEAELFASLSRSNDS